MRKVVIAMVLGLMVLGLGKAFGQQSKLVEAWPAETKVTADNTTVKITVNVKVKNSDNKNHDVSVKVCPVRGSYARLISCQTKSTNVGCCKTTTGLQFIFSCSTSHSTEGQQCGADDFDVTVTHVD